MCFGAGMERVEWLLSKVAVIATAEPVQQVKIFDIKTFGQLESLSVHVFKRVIVHSEDDLWKSH